MKKWWEELEKLEGKLIGHPRWGEFPARCARKNDEQFQKNMEFGRKLREAGERPAPKMNEN